MNRQHKDTKARRHQESAHLRDARFLGVFVPLCLCVVLQIAAQTRVADWPMYNRDLGGTRYFPHAQINASNVSTLKMAWTYRLSNAPAGGGRGGGGAPPTVNPEATPIVINGIMYLPAGSRVLALEDET